MTEPEAIQDGARRLSRLLNRDGKTIHVRPGDKPTFLPETCFAIRYAKEGQAMIGVFDETLNRLFPSRKAKTTFTKALIKVGAIQNGHGHAGTVQERLPVVIRGETIDRPRFWPFDAGQFIALCARA
jgi:hypothetical protein